MYFVAGLFEQDELLVKAFEYAVATVNEREATGESKINAIIQNEIQKDKPFAALQETCNVLGKGILAVFGPSSYSNIDIVQSICDTKEIPHIITR